jgi:hypothetical protein
VFAYLEFAVTSGQIEQQVELHLDDGLDVLGQNGQLARIGGELFQRV